MKRYIKASTSIYTLEEYNEQLYSLLHAAEEAFPQCEFRLYFTQKEMNQEWLNKAAEDDWWRDYYLAFPLKVIIDEYLDKTITFKNIFKVTPEALINRIQKLLDRTAAQIEQSPRKIVYDVCKLMGWSMPMFIDRNKSGGFKVKWGGHPFRGTQEDIDYINDQLGLHCYLTRAGYLVLAE